MGIGEKRRYKNVVQRMPSLLSRIQVAVDEHPGENGQYILTGSHQPALQSSVGQSLADYKAVDDALHRKFTKVSNRNIKKNLERLVAAKAKVEVRCLSAPNCTDGADLATRHRYLNSLGIPEPAIVDLKYYDYGRSKYLALGMKDTMP